MTADAKGGILMFGYGDAYGIFSLPMRASVAKPARYLVMQMQMFQCL